MAGAVHDGDKYAARRPRFAASSPSMFERQKMAGYKTNAGGWIRTFALASAIFTIELSAAASAQDPRHASQIIEANSERLRIVDGGDVREGVLVAELELDTYLVHPSSAPKRVSMVTDLDRIDFMVAQGETYDFAVRFNNRLYRQRITSVDPAPPAYRGAAARADGIDTVPFRLGPNNAIHIQGSVNGASDLDLIFDTGASVSVLGESGRRKGATIRDGETNVVAFSGVEIGDLPMLFIDYAGTLRADGVIGYDAFAGRVVEIDHDGQTLRIHHARPSVDEYSRVPITWRGSASLVPISIETHDARRTVLAILDTGSMWSLTLNHDDPLAADASSVAITGIRRGRKADGAGLWLNVFDLPAVEFGGHRLRQVQADVTRNPSAAALQFNILGNDFLKRFDLIIDYRTSEVFVRPNSIVSSPYNPSIPMGIGAIGALLGVAAFALLAFVSWTPLRTKRGRRVRRETQRAQG